MVNTEKLGAFLENGILIAYTGKCCVLQPNVCSYWRGLASNVLDSKGDGGSACEDF